jgi:hypothetical protein
LVKLRDVSFMPALRFVSFRSQRRAHRDVQSSSPVLN